MVSNFHYYHKLETLIKCNASIAGFGDALKQQTAEGLETIIVSLRFFDANEEGYTNNELDFFVVGSVEYILLDHLPSSLIVEPLFKL